jgi:hypothetical protein
MGCETLVLWREGLITEEGKRGLDSLSIASGLLSQASCRTQRDQKVLARANRSPPDLQNFRDEMALKWGRFFLGARVKYLHWEVCAMTREDEERFEWLCRQVQTEKDPEKFDLYVRELNDLLEAKHERIHQEQDAQPT